MDSTRSNLEYTGRTTKQRSCVKVGKKIFFLFHSERKKTSFSTWEKTWKSLLPPTPFLLCNPTQQVLNRSQKGLNIFKCSLLDYRQNLLVLWSILNTVCIEIIFISIWIVSLWVQELEMKVLKTNSLGTPDNFLSFYPPWNSECLHVRGVKLFNKSILNVQFATLNSSPPKSNKNKKNLPLLVMFNKLLRLLLANNTFVCTDLSQPPLLCCVKKVHHWVTNRIIICKKTTKCVL